MKNVSKFASLLLALIIAMAMMVPAFASGEGDGSITINGITANATYKIFKMLDLESYDTTTGAYSYKVNAAWTGFFATDDAKAYMTVDENGYVTANVTDVAEFAQLALAYAEAKDIDAVKSSENEGEFAVTGEKGVFSGLELGYYLVDTSVGALCGLTTTNPSASLQAKNVAPTIDKQVQEDNGNTWGDANSADVGQIVNFRVTINVHTGAENFVLHDVMSEGLTFGEVTEILLGSSVVDPANYTVKSGDDVACDKEGCTFEVAFTDEFCASLNPNDKLYVHYNAMLNRDAVIAGDGNPNTAQLEYGDEHFTTEDSTVTKTYAVDIIKTDGQNFLLDGAEFLIYDAPTGGNVVEVIELDSDDKNAKEGVNTYRRARADEAGMGVSIVVEGGQARVIGLDNGDYYLEETVYPEGYNKLTTRVKFTIADKNHDAVFNDGVYSKESGVQVINKSGTMLPETGGIGTTLFYVFGGALVAVAVVLLVTKRRMAER